MYLQELQIGFADFERAICSSIEMQLKCIDDIAPKCHTNQTHNDLRFSQVLLLILLFHIAASKSSSNLHILSDKIPCTVG